MAACSDFMLLPETLFSALEGGRVGFEEAHTFQVCSTVLDLPSSPSLTCLLESLPLACGFRVMKRGHDLQVCGGEERGV